MNRFVLYPYKLGSRSVNLLRDALPAHKVRPDGQYRYREGDVVINWGNSTVPTWLTEEAMDGMLNLPQLVGVASNKLRCLQHLESDGVPTVPFTTDPVVASEWPLVYARHILQGHSGEGIELVHEGTQVPVAPLYTKGLQNNGEYRVHVMNGQVIDYRKKVRHEGDVPLPEQENIRTLGNGWVYRRDGLRRLERVEELALRAIESIGLDFGAVDIINDQDGNVFVLEVNTAVGLEERTLETYVNSFNQNYGQ